MERKRVTRKMASMKAMMNGSIASCSSLINPTALKIGMTIAYCLILVVSLVGNSIILFIVYKTQSTRKPINFFIVNMAMSDLLFPITLIPAVLLTLYVKSWITSGPLGQALCKLEVVVIHVSRAVSIQSLVLIAVDRFGAVVFPLRSPLISSKLCPFILLATWVVAIAFFSPLLLAANVVEYGHGQQMCALSLLSAVNFFLVLSIVFCYIPLVLLTILYSIIFIKLKLQKIPGEQSVNADEQRARRNRNALKMAIAIVSGFALCWVPFSIFNLLSVYFAWDKLTFSCGFVLYGIIAFSIMIVNCAMNPCICFIFSENYRRGLKRLLKCFG